MAPPIDDRWLWLGFGVFFFFAARGIRSAIQDVVRLTELDPYQYEPKNTKEEKLEDTITLENLRTLSGHHNSNIANSAISLTISRFARDPAAYQSLIHDLHSSDEIARARANQAISYLRDVPLPTDLDAPPLPWTPPPDDPPVQPELNAGAEMVETYVRRLAYRGMDGGVDGAQPDVVVPSSASPVAGWTNVPRERPAVADATRAQIEARRWRREAMVLHEGEGGVVEEDIIRPP